MKVLNIHERQLAATAEAVGALIDTLSSTNDAVWPARCWPRMMLDRPLGVGAVGGHGPIRYVVEAYEPGRCVQFRFTAPKGFDGFHAMELESGDGSTVVLRHRLEMTTHGVASLTWPLMIRWLHDALVEDAFATAEVALGLEPRVLPWSRWVRILRFISSRGKARPQSELTGH